MTEKKCSRCKHIKDQLIDFYMCNGKWRSECKACTVKRNVNYQRKKRTWETREVDLEQRRAYMLSYYAKNKNKFAHYRQTFKQRNPDYHRTWASQKKLRTRDINE